MREITKQAMIRQVMRQRSVSYSVAKKFIDGALREIETRLRNQCAVNAARKTPTQ